MGDIIDGGRSRRNSFGSSSSSSLKERLAGYVNQDSAQEETVSVPDAELDEPEDREPELRIDGRVLYLETGEDRLRLYTHRDEILEAGEQDGTAYRIYANQDGDWYGKIRRTDTSTDGYVELNLLADEIVKAHDTDLHTTPSIYQAAMDEFDGTQYLYDEEAGIFLRYDDEHHIDIPMTEGDKKRGNLRGRLESIGKTALGSGGLNAAVAAIAGAASPAIPLLSAIAIGGGIGACIGGSLGGIPVWCNWLDEHQEKRTEMSKKKRQDSYASGEAKKAAEEAIEELNELNSEYLQGSVPRPKLDDDSWTPQAKDLLRQFRGITQALFQNVEKLEGAAAVREADSYGEARDFVSRFVDIGNDVRPSLYRDEDAFAHIFEALPEPEQSRLIRNVFENDTDPAVKRYLEEKHEALLEDVGDQQMVR